jgi:hypothetical protein
MRRLVHARLVRRVEPGVYEKVDWTSGKRGKSS